MKPCIHFWFFFAWWTLGQFAKKWGTCRTCISTLRCPNWILKIQKNFKNFEKFFFAQIFIWYALECLKMSCDNFFLHVMVIHLIFGTLLIDDIAQNLWIRATYFCTSKAGLLVEKSCYWINRTRNHFIKFRSFICESPTTRTMTTCITGNLIGKVDVSAWNDVSIDLLDTKLLTFTQESVVTISLVTIKKDPEEDGFTFMKFNVYSK